MVDMTKTGSNARLKQGVRRAFDGPVLEITEMEAIDRLGPTGALEIFRRLGESRQLWSDR